MAMFAQTFRPNSWYGSEQQEEQPTSAEVAEKYQQASPLDYLGRPGEPPEPKIHCATQSH